MNKRRVISVAVCLVVAALVLVVKYHPRTVPVEECSQIYRDYADNPHIAVAFIKDFPVNDTLRVDVTTLQATDSLGWETLKNEFHIISLSDNIQRKIEQGIDRVSTRIVSKTDPTLPMDTSELLNNNVIAISRLHRTVSVFYIKAEAEIDAILYNQLNIDLPN
jgi:hypothetical protein